MRIKKLVETFDNKKTSNKDTLSEMTIGYDENTIKRMISQLENEIEDYEQLIVDEPEDADYWKEMIAKCQDEITELKSYKPLEESSKDSGGEGGQSTGFIRTNCAECGKKNRVEVVFPSSSEGFEDTEYTCSSCGTRNVVTDPHKYDSKGRIVEASYGGAYDISDDQYFTREEITEFGEQCVEVLNELGDGQVELVSSYVDGKCLEVTVSCDGYEETAYCNIDMRRIRKPSQLFTACGREIINQLKEALSDDGFYFEPTHNEL